MKLKGMMKDRRDRVRQQIKATRRAEAIYEKGLHVVERCRLELLAAESTVARRATETQNQKEILRDMWEQLEYSRKLRLGR
jgi:membrane carboxypeptidase/penicillin-binding protein